MIEAAASWLEAAASILFSGGDVATSLSEQAITADQCGAGGPGVRPPFNPEWLPDDPAILNAE